MHSNSPIQVNSSQKLQTSRVNLAWVLKILGTF